MNFIGSSIESWASSHTKSWMKLHEFIYHWRSQKQSATVIWVVRILQIMTIYILTESSEYFARKDQRLKVELQRSNFFQSVKCITASNEPSTYAFELIKLIDWNSPQLRSQKLYHISLSIIVINKGLIVKIFKCKMKNTWKDLNNNNSIGLILLTSTKTSNTKYKHFMINDRLMLWKKLRRLQTDDINFIHSIKFLRFEKDCYKSIAN